MTYISPQLVEPLQFLFHSARTAGSGKEFGTPLGRYPLCQHRPQTVWAEIHVLMAVAHMTCYQHFINKISMVHACFEKQRV